MAKVSHQHPALRCTSVWRPETAGNSQTWGSAGPCWPSANTALRTFLLFMIHLSASWGEVRRRWCTHSQSRFLSWHTELFFRRTHPARCHAESETPTGKDVHPAGARTYGTVNIIDCMKSANLSITSFCTVLKIIMNKRCLFLWQQFNSDLIILL